MSILEQKVSLCMQFFRKRAKHLKGKKGKSCTKFENILQKGNNRTHKTVRLDPTGNITNRG